MGLFSEKASQSKCATMMEQSEGQGDINQVHWVRKIKVLVYAREDMPCMLAHSCLYHSDHFSTPGGMMQELCHLD